MPIRRALISVSDKAGLIEFAQQLGRLNIALLSTGGTCKSLREAGLAVTEVSEFTGFPEILDGRVKTLHPKIHGGILAREGMDELVLDQHGIVPIDLVVVNLYPFAATIRRPDCSFELAIENIDIGGPSLLRAAAKNHARVAVLADPADYPRFLESLADNRQALPASLRLELAAKAFAHTAAYDANVASYLEQLLEPGNLLPSTFRQISVKQRDLRYGENPQQRAAFYPDALAAPQSLGAAEQRQGKALSFNNIADTDAALQCVLEFAEPSCVIVKHANPCGVASASDPLSAYEAAYATDPTSAFGGIIAFNRELDASTAAAILQRQFVEVIIAPGITRAAAEVLARKPDIRVLSTAGAAGVTGAPVFDLKRVSGGLLVQDLDTARVRVEDLKTVTEIAPTATQLADLMFAWRVVKYVKSNAIVYAGNQQTLGIGAGQMSRVHSARLGVIKAQEQKLSLEGSVLASDAFFPFRDGIDAAAAVGVKAIIQPGGSIRDAEVIAAANTHGIAMVFTGIRHFRH